MKILAQKARNQADSGLGTPGCLVAQKHNELVVYLLLTGRGVTPNWTETPQTASLHTPGATCSQPHSKECFLAHCAPSGWRTKQPAPRQRLTDLMIQVGLLPKDESLLQQTVQQPSKSQLQKGFKKLFLYICILKIKRLST